MLGMALKNAFDKNKNWISALSGNLVTERLVAAHDQQDRQEELAVELEQRQEDGRMPRGGHVVLRVIVDQLPEQARRSRPAGRSLGSRECR